jgi:hypothetical protein
MELGYTSKRESILYNMIYKVCKSLKNCRAQEVIVSSVQIELHGSVSRQTYLAESGLTIITFRNCISSSNLRDGVWMSTWWESNAYSSIWNTIYEFWISGVFVLEDPTSLSGQLFWVWISLSHFTPCKETSNIWIQVSQYKVYHVEIEFLGIYQIFPERFEPL